MFLLHKTVLFFQKTYLGPNLNIYTPEIGSMISLKTVFLNL